MSLENRGGIPIIRRLVVSTTGFKWQLPATSKFVQISNEGANPCRIYFFQADFDSDTNYISLAATTGFYEGPTEARDIWLRTTGGTSDPVVFIAYMKRG